MKIHPAPTDDRIMIPSSFSIIGVRPRFPRMVKIVTQEIEAEIREKYSRSLFIKPYRSKVDQKTKEGL